MSQAKNTGKTQILCGRVALTVSPDIKSENFEKLRMEMPKDFALDELPTFVLFIMAVFGPEYIMPLQPHVKALLQQGKKHNQKLNGYDLNFFADGDLRVMMVEPTHPKS